MNHSSISREFKRHIIDGTYDPSVAQQRAQYRRHHKAKNKISQKTIDYAEFGLSIKWSLEQISGVSDLIGLLDSHEWIYGYAHRNKRQALLAFTT